jgi:cytoskeletal protein RodZ
LKAPEDLDEAKLAAEAVPPPVKPKPKRKLIGSLIGFFVLLSAAYVVWQQFQPEPPPPAAPVAPDKPAAPTQPAPLTPSDTLNKIATLPGEMVGRAQDAIAAKRDSEQMRVDALAAGEEPPVETPAAPAPEPVAPPAAPTTVEVQSQTEIAPGLTATNTTVMAMVEASPAFSAFVAEMRINGVFQGSPARALINGHTYREGQLVDPGLGIVFDHIEPATKQIVFRDQSGATVSRKY